MVKAHVQLKPEIISFVEIQKNTVYSSHDELWWLKVHFLADFFDKPNCLNLSLHGLSEIIITATLKLTSIDLTKNLFG